jgi:hypothetical protein
LLLRQIHNRKVSQCVREIKPPKEPDEKGRLHPL